MSQQSINLTAEEATTVRGVFQLVSNKIEESKKQFQLAEDQHRMILNTLITMILDNRGFPGIVSWSTKLTDDAGKIIEPVTLTFEDGAITPVAEQKAPSLAKKTKKKSR